MGIQEDRLVFVRADRAQICRVDLKLMQPHSRADLGELTLQPSDLSPAIRDEDFELRDLISLPLDLNRWRWPGDSMSAKT